MLHLPYELYSAEQTRELDRIVSEKHGISAAELMTRAGAAALQTIQTHWPQAKNILIVCGSGNNGGDGYELARQALTNAYHVVTYEVGKVSKMSKETQAARTALLAVGGEIYAFDGQLPATDITVDALFGTGLDRDISGRYAHIIETINTLKSIPVLALDIPSGIHADTGKALGIAVQADMTISFIGLNIGLFNGDAPDYCGKIGYDSLAVPESVYKALTPIAHRIDLNTAAMTALAPRQRTAHKGHFGHLFIIGGDHGMSGAPRIAAEAAARVGAGLISIGTRSVHAATINLTRPELMCHAVEKPEHLESLLQAANVITLGPGLGQSSWSQALFEKALAANLAMVVDADALNLLSQTPQHYDNWVLTPHPGEAGRLLGTSSKLIQADRMTAIKKLHQRYGGVIVLKGCGTLIYNGHQPVWLSTFGNPGMASGGMGDALAGIIGGLLAQGLDLLAAASIGVTLHGMAADKAAEQDGERGMLAMDLMPHLRHLANLKY